MSLRAILQTIRHYQLSLLPSHKDPSVHRWQNPDRDDTGRFARGHSEGQLPAINPSPNALEGIQQEERDIAAGHRQVYRDGTSSLMVTSGKDYPPLPVATVRDVRGTVIEPVFYEMLKPPAVTNGFTLTASRGEGIPRNALMYNYYTRGIRPANGLPNRDHLEKIALEVMPHYAKYAKRIQVSPHIGHVKNEGWETESHMERVHLSDPYPQDPDHALGIERSQQGSLLFVPKPGEEGVLPDLAAAIQDHAREQGYLWDYPDLRVFGEAAPEVEGFERFPMLYVPGRGGYYTSIGTEVPQALADIFPQSNVRQVQIPANWKGILGPVNPERLADIRKAYHDQTGQTAYHRRYMAAPADSQWLRLKQAQMSPAEVAALYAYVDSRILGAEPQAAKQYATDAYLETDRALAALGDQTLQHLREYLGYWFSANDLDSLDWNQAIDKFVSDGVFQ